MIFVSNPSILFKKSQVLQGFFLFLSLKLSYLPSCFFSPNVYFFSGRNYFLRSEECVCVCVCAHVHAWTCTLTRKRQIERHIEKETEGCVCVSVCVCLYVFTNLLAENPAFTFSGPFCLNCYLCFCVIYLQEIADRFKC